MFIMVGFYCNLPRNLVLAVQFGSPHFESILFILFILEFGHLKLSKIGGKNFTEHNHYLHWLKDLLCDTCSKFRKNYNFL